MGGDDLCIGFTIKKVSLAGGKMQDGAKGVEVGAGIERSILKLLRRHEMDGPDRGIRADFAGSLSQFEVDELEVEAAAGEREEHEIRWRDVAMNDACRMNGGEGLQALARKRLEPGHRQRPALNAGVERFTVQEFEDEKAPVRIRTLSAKGDDIRVGDPRQGIGFTLMESREGGDMPFDCHFPIQQSIPGAYDAAATTGGDEFQQLVAVGDHG